MTSPSPSTIRAASRLLVAGGLVAFPTETVYGLGADATSPDAVSRIFAVKSRPAFNPLIAHVASVEDAAAEGIFTKEADDLAAHFWPGPLTLVLARVAGGRVCDLACAGLASVALRMPSHPIALEIIRAAGRPVAAPSANRSGRLSPTRAADVRAEFGGVVDLVVDGGGCSIGVESTIIACAEGHVTMLRPGGLSRDAIETIIGRRLDVAGKGITAPGMLASHYAPSATLRLNATRVAAMETGLDFGASLGGDWPDLSPSGDLREAAANLYLLLRMLDAKNPRVIAVAPIPNNGLGEAINDRLRRAAAPRDATSAI